VDVWIIIAIVTVILLAIFFIGYVYGYKDNDIKWKKEMENWEVIRKDKK